MASAAKTKTDGHGIIGMVEYDIFEVVKNALVEFLDRSTSAYLPYKDIEDYEMLTLHIVKSTTLNISDFFPR